MRASFERTACAAAAMTLFGWMLFAGSPEAVNLQLIGRLDECVRNRFADPAPKSLGMSRVAAPVSFGLHYQPNVTSRRDFDPENPAEASIVGEMERRQLQVGLYVFGRAAAAAGPTLRDYRALKGPAAITEGTPRPAWYPPLARLAAQTAPHGDTLPDWEAIYPLARRAMKSFQDGGKGFETTLDSWSIAVRPLIASQQRCVACHNNPVYSRVASAKLGEPLGGVIYAFRQDARP